MNNFQERLNDLINEYNLNRLQLANKIGVSSTTINGYFNNGYFPQINIAINICKFFNCSLDYLFGFSDLNNPQNTINLNKLNINLINNVDFLIKQNKISANKLFKDLNMSESNYYRWKNGQFPKTINLIEIAKYFDVGIDYLLENKSGR